MNKLLLITTLLFIIVLACGTGEDRVATVQCDVTPNPQGYTLNCPGNAPVELTSGSNGPQGIPGLDGANGSTITPVQFCTAFTPQYPDSFPEYGLCINNQLYGVYWNGTTAFLAYLPPGAYNSTSLSNTTCNFTIVSGCTVQ